MIIHAIKAPFYQRVTEGSLCSACMASTLETHRYYRDDDYAIPLGSSSHCTRCHHRRSEDASGKPVTSLILDGEPMKIFTD